jgi:DNA-binding LytR/AlgR family response regulator
MSKEGYIHMINFAFCYENDDELNFMKNEIQKCFKVRDIEIAIRTYHCAYELLKNLGSNCPDVLFYDFDGEDGLIHEAALAAKDRNENLIAVVTRNGNAEGDYPLHDDEDCVEALLETSYTLPSISRKHLWMYACLAYDACLDDEDSFTYYVRPDYEHVHIRDIMYFASEGRRTHIITHRYRDTFYQRLDEVQDVIKQKRGHFVRIHQSYLVNTQYIVSYNRQFVTLLNGERLRISKYNYYRLLNNNIRDSDLPIKKIAGYC